MPSTLQKPGSTSSEKAALENTVILQNGRDKKKILKKLLRRKFRRLPVRILRIAVIALAAYLFFGFVCRPGFVKGSSMEPTYHNFTMLFYSPLALKATALKRGDVVTVRYGSDRMLLLKRVLAFEGELVEFRNGTLYINGILQEEPYVKYPCSWTIRPLIVQKGKVYVAGDNRSMPAEQHVFGQVDYDLLRGKALW